jgi:hypothetical protein
MLRWKLRPGVPSGSISKLSCCGRVAISAGAILHASARQVIKVIYQEERCGSLEPAPLATSRTCPRRRAAAQATLERVGQRELYDLTDLLG